MTGPKPLFFRLPALLLGLVIGFTAVAQQAPIISDLTYLDRQYMQQRRDELDSLARSRLGRQFRGETGSDIDLLQALLDRRLDL